MSNNIIFMFSGQGSQYYHMAEELYNNDSVFRENMQEIDSLVYDSLGCSIIDKIYDKDKRKEEEFSRLLYTHIAIFMVEYSLTKSLIHNGIEPEYVAGASLGEFVAACISGIIDEKTALEIILKQAELIEEKCDKGGMIAVLHDPQLYYNEKTIRDNSTIASINFKSHFVLSASYEKLNLIENFLKEKNIINQRLPVNYAFHSKEMIKIKDSYLKLLNNKIINKPNIKFISSLYGEVIDSVSNDYFYNVIEYPIKFTSIVSKIYRSKKWTLMDLGPSGTLANFIKYDNKEMDNSSIFSIIAPFGNDFKRYSNILENYN